MAFHGSRTRRRLIPFFGAIILVAIGLITLPPSRAAAQTTPPRLRIFAFNDLGMHCYDHSFAVLSLLPLFNVLHAQVIETGAIPRILNDTEVALSYKAVADPGGSINTTSRRKTNFWRFAGPLFGAVDLPVDTGLLGARMPGNATVRRPFLSYSPDTQWFGAEGIPITTYDDAGLKNSYPLMQVVVRNLVGGRNGASPPTVLPVSDEMRCDSCHATGGIAARTLDIRWSRAADPLVQSTQNVLLVHDRNEGTTLFDSRPVLCASCHYSKALDLSQTGPPNNGHRFMSHSIHSFHAPILTETPGSPDACYACHPGAQTRCLRGVMANAGLVCSDCHGITTAVGDVNREPWVDLPKCQSCHTGDAVQHLGADIRLRRAYGNDPSIATPRLSPNKRFAENRDRLNPPKALLYRNSVGHGGVACESCHGSPHAEWPTSEPNDNLAAVAHQGYPGKITECSVCHGRGQQPTLNGPHGMHNVASTLWINRHSRFFGTGADCQPCHGLAGEGTVLSKTPVDRTLTVATFPGGVVNIAAGTQVNCSLCHANPL